MIVLVLTVLLFTLVLFVLNDVSWIFTLGVVLTLLPEIFGFKDSLSLTTIVFIIMSFFLIYEYAEQGRFDD